MRECPGKWALLDEHMPGRKSTSLADNIRRGNLAAFQPRGAFEARAYNGSVWARYVGTDGQ